MVEITEKNWKNYLQQTFSNIAFVVQLSNGFLPLCIIDEVLGLETWPMYSKRLNE